MLNSNVGASLFTRMLFYLDPLFVGDGGGCLGFWRGGDCFHTTPLKHHVALITFFGSMVRFVNTQRLPSKYCTFFPHPHQRAKLVLFLIIRIHPGFARLFLFFLIVYFKNNLLNKYLCASRHWPWGGKR